MIATLHCVIPYSFQVRFFEQSYLIALATPPRRRAPSTYTTPDHNGVIVGKQSADIKHKDPRESGRKCESRGTARLKKSRVACRKVDRVEQPAPPQLANYNRAEMRCRPNRRLISAIAGEGRSPNKKRRSEPVHLDFPYLQYMQYVPCSCYWSGRSYG